MNQTYVALLRGVNVGGKNRLPMKDLVAVCERAGCLDVRTYIQSGNAVFQAESGLETDLASALRAGIADSLGLTVPVTVRTLEAMQALCAANPFLPEGPEEALHVLFLAETPSPEAVSKLDPDRSPGDRFAVIGREVYLHLPNGVADSRLTNAYFDGKLQTVGTARNWRTTLALLNMMG